VDEDLSYFVFFCFFSLVVIIIISLPISCQSLRRYERTKSLVVFSCYLNFFFSCTIMLNYMKSIFLHKYIYAYISSNVMLLIIGRNLQRNLRKYHWTYCNFQCLNSGLWFYRILYMKNFSHRTAIHFMSLHFFLSRYLL